MGGREESINRCVQTRGPSSCCSLVSAPLLSNLRSAIQFDDTLRQGILIATYYAEERREAKGFLAASLLAKVFDLLRSAASFPINGRILRTRRYVDRQFGNSRVSVSLGRGNFTREIRSDDSIYSPR